LDREFVFFFTLFQACLKVIVIVVFAAGDQGLIDYLLAHVYSPSEVANYRDDMGRTMLHSLFILVAEPRSDISAGVVLAGTNMVNMVINLLISCGVNASAQDHTGKMAVDYLSSTSPYVATLNRACELAASNVSLPAAASNANRVTAGRTVSSSSNPTIAATSAVPAAPAAVTVTSEPSTSTTTPTLVLPSKVLPAVATSTTPAATSVSLATAAAATTLRANDDSGMDYSAIQNPILSAANFEFHESADISAKHEGRIFSLCFCDAIDSVVEIININSKVVIE
jgi:hypothetical protein